jgi:methionyl-tRNA formyltransferase
MEKRNQVTTFFIDEIDTGAMILSSEMISIQMKMQDTDRLMHLGSRTVINTLKLIERNVITTIQKDASRMEINF